MSQVVNTLARWIVKNGMACFDRSMLSDEMNSRILSEAGAMFFNLGKIAEAIDAFSIANNNAMLLWAGDKLMDANRFREAAKAYIPTKDREKLDKAASVCMQAGDYKLALQAYEASGNIEMANFVRNNAY